MGRQYGRLLQGELNEFYARAVEGYLLKAQGVTDRILKEASQEFHAACPERFRQLIAGMAETSGLGWEKIDLKALFRIDSP